MQNADMYTLLCYVQPLWAFRWYQKENFKPFWSRCPGAKVSSKMWHQELIFHTKDSACCPHQALPPSTLLQKSKTSTAAVLDSWARVCWERGKALAFSVQMHHEQAGQTVLLCIRCPCLVLSWRQQCRYKTCRDQCSPLLNSLLILHGAARENKQIIKPLLLTGKHANVCQQQPGAANVTLADHALTERSLLVAFAFLPSPHQSSEEDPLS